MSWKDGFTAKGSFKGAEFYVRESELEAGRRVQVHEYPARDEPYAEDLGRKARKLQFEAYCIGPDYHIARDALIAKAEEAGSGTLVHPYHGTLTVTLTAPIRVRESTRNGGYAAITIQCVEAGTQSFPSVSRATQAAVRLAAEQSIADSINAFADVFAITDAASAVDDYLAEVDDIFLAVASVVGSVSGPLADIIRSPAELGAAIAGAVTNISNIATEPQRAMQIYQTLFSAGSDPVPWNSSARAKQTARNSQATNELVRQVAVIASCDASTNLELSPDKQGDTPITRNQIFTMRNELIAAIDARHEVVDVITGAPINDSLFSSLADLRNAVSIDLSARGGRLPVVITVTHGATLPAIVLAQKLYGNASRDSELINLNNIRHPGFVRGGEKLEALSE